MRQPLISVIVPAYNLEDCLGRALDSILKQGIKDMEVIVVDDLSSDGTWELIKKYQKNDKRIVPIHMNQRSKPSGARNAALEVATGKYIHFCDGDDAIPAKSYKIMLEIAEKENVDIVTGNYMRMYPNERNAVRPFSQYTSNTAIERCFEKSNTTLWNKLYRRSFIEEHGLRFDETLRYSEDLLFYMEFMLGNPKAGYTDANVYIYTEPTQNVEIDESIIGVQRFANKLCMQNGMYCYSHVFEKPLTKNIEQWKILYRDNLNWHYQCVFRLINSPKEKEEAYTCMKDEIIKIAKANPGVLDWSDAKSYREFVDIMHMSFATFQTLTYREFLILDSIRERARCNFSGVNLQELHEIISEINIKESNDVDKVLYDKLIEQINDIKARYLSTKYIYQKKLIQSTYWTEWQLVVRHTWAPIQNIELKKNAWNIMRDTITVLSDNEICSLLSETAFWKIREVFGVDYPTLMALSYEEYILATSIKEVKEDLNTDVQKIFIDDSYAGNVGMKVIMKAARGWMTFKINRKLKR
ncbi:glycosyltransferase family 2 protein [Enterocloster lavalensis]|uniref:glycosyltransferase family 2 protein n=1 Tax=Enterocloster lavalensis TaxID=460384 RepID=UPI0034A1C652